MMTRKWMTYGLWLKGGGLAYFLMSEGPLEELDSPPPPSTCTNSGIKVEDQTGKKPRIDQSEHPAVMGDQLHRKSG
jgi:hypothetical protein